MYHPCQLLKTPSFSSEKVPCYLLHSIFCLVATVKKWKVLSIGSSVQSVHTQEQPLIYIFQAFEEVCLTSLSLMSQQDSFDFFCLNTIWDGSCIVSLLLCFHLRLKSQLHCYSEWWYISLHWEKISNQPFHPIISIEYCHFHVKPGHTVSLSL